MMILKKCYNKQSVKILTLLTLLSVPALSANAEPRVCEDEIIASGTFDGIVVKPNSFCFINPDVIVNGDFIADNATRVGITGAHISGDVVITNSSALEGVIVNSGAKIGGRLEISGNSVQLLSISGFSVGKVEINGSVLIQNNTLRVFVLRNTNIGNHVNITNNLADTTQPGNFVVRFISTKGNVNIENNEHQNLGYNLQCNNISGSLKIIENNFKDMYMGGDCSSDSGAIGSIIDKNLQITDNRTFGGNITIEQIGVNKNLLLIGNSLVNQDATDGVFNFSSSLIKGNAICKANTPALTQDPSLAGTVIEGRDNCLQ